MIIKGYKAAANPYWRGNWGVHPGAESFVERKDTGPYSDYRDIPFDYETFASNYPEFRDNPNYTVPFLSAVAKRAQMFVRTTWCRELDGADRAYAYLLMVAHLAVLTKQQQVGLVGTATPGTGPTAGMDTMPGVMTQASVGGVSVSKTGVYQPKNQWDSWMYQTPYGRELLAFLRQAAAPGLIYEGEENIANCLRD